MLAGDLSEVEEEFNRATHQIQLLRVIKLKPERTGGGRRGQRTQMGALLKEQRPQSGACGVEGGGRSDNATANDDEIGGRRYSVNLPHSLMSRARSTFSTRHETPHGGW